MAKKNEFFFFFFSPKFGDTPKPKRDAHERPYWIGALSQLGIVINRIQIAKEQQAQGAVTAAKPQNQRG